MKVLKKLLMSLFILAVLVTAVFTGLGYVKYKDAVSKNSLYDAVIEIRQREDFTPYSELSEYFVEATVAVEDRRFFDRKGLDFISIGRALMTNLVNGEVKEGGSTITQQVAKNIYFDNKPSLIRKIAEVFLLYDLERNYTKEEILELYVNIIYYGDGYYGITDASNGYYKLLPSQLNLSQSSMLAGLPQSPSRFQLSTGLQLAKERQKSVLQDMQTNGYINVQELKQALEWSDENE